MKVNIVIPVYNEEKYIQKFIRDLFAEVNIVKDKVDVIFVNDGSTDNTLKIINDQARKRRQITVISHTTNLGKGVSLRSGVKHAQSKGADIIVFIDGDCQHDPKYLHDFIISAKENPIVFGYRHLGRNAPLLRVVGNKLAKFIFRALFQIKRKDLLCGYMAFQNKSLSQIKWSSNSYEVEAEISAIVAKARLPFEEILVNTTYIDRKKGVNLLDAFFIFLKIPFWYFQYENFNYSLFLGFIALTSIFLILAYKNPFAPNSLIGNLEPYPDTLYYAVPAWNFVKSGLFGMYFNSHLIRTITPPLYSLILIPFFMLFQDVRVFYFVNVMLMIGSIFMFLLLCKYFYQKGLYNFILIIFLGFFFVTNYFIYTLPSFLMAENLTIFLLLMALYLLWSSETKIKAYFAGTIGILFALTKFANLPIGATFYFLYTLKLLKSRKYIKEFLISGCLSFIAFIYYIFYSQILRGHKNLQTGSSFGLSYFWKNLNFYLDALRGKPTDFLWFRARMYSVIIYVAVVVGTISGLFSKQLRSKVLQLILFIFLSVIFMSFFYAADARFVFSLYPLILILSGTALYQLRKKLRPSMALLLMFLLLIIYLVLPNISQLKDKRLYVTLKKQIGLNFRHQETPWYYLASQEFNKFFADTNHKDSYLGSFLPPFFINFYTNSTYHYLPISQNQDFFDEMGIDDLNMYYEKLLKNKQRIFVSNVYVNNLIIWKKDFEKMKDEFNFKLAKEGCLQSCNIYELSLKNEK